MADPPEDKKRKGMSELEMFDELFPTLVGDLTKNGIKDDEISSAVEWFKKVNKALNILYVVWSVRDALQLSEVSCLHVQINYRLLMLRC